MPASTDHDLYSPASGAGVEDMVAALARTSLPVAVVDLATRRVVGVSGPAAAILGAQPEDLAGHPVARFVASEPTGGVPLLATGRLDGFEAPRELRHVNGTVVDTYVWVHVLGADRPARFAAVILNTELELPPPLRLPATDDGWTLIGSVDRRWHVDRISAEAATVLGYERVQLQSAPVMSVVHPSDLPELLTGLAHVHASGRDAAVRVRIRRGDGTYLWCRARLAKMDESSRFLFTLRPLTMTQPPHADRVRDLEMRLARIAAEVRNATLVSGPAGMRSVADVPGLADLSTREWEVLTELAQGRRVPAIAADLGLSEGTIRNHLSGVYRKLGVASQSEVLALVSARSSR